MNLRFTVSSTLRTISSRAGGAGSSRRRPDALRGLVVRRRPLGQQDGLRRIRRVHGRRRVRSRVRVQLRSAIRLCGGLERGHRPDEPDGQPYRRHPRRKLATRPATSGHTSQAARGSSASRRRSRNFSIASAPTISPSTSAAGLWRSSTSTSVFAETFAISAP